MELTILGPVRLLMSEPIDVGATKVRGLLGYLCYKANEPVHVDRIAEALWDGDTPADTGKALQTYASRLRRVLRAANCPAVLTNEHRPTGSTSTSPLSTTTASSPSSETATEPEATATKKRRRSYFAAALVLWSGPFLADLDTPWARRTRDTLTTRDLMPAQCALFDTRLSLGDHDFVLVDAPAAPVRPPDRRRPCHPVDPRAGGRRPR